MRLKKILSAAVCITLLISTATYGVSKLKTISVNFDVIKKIMIDNVDRTPKSKKALMYEGSIYVPIQELSDSIGKKVTWDAKNGVLYLGNSKNQIEYLTDIKPYNISEFENKMMQTKSYKIDSIMTMANKKYSKGIQLQPEGYQMRKVFYNLDGVYSSISGLVGIDDSDNAFPFADPIIVNFYCDDKLVKTFNFYNGDLPKEFTIDVKGCAKFTVEVGCERNNHPLVNIVDSKIK